MIYVGIDVHRAKGVAAIKNSEGMLLESHVYSNNHEGISRFVAKLKAYGDTVKAAIESSGNLWVQTYEALEENGFQVVLSNPFKTRAIADAKIKSDKFDASTLADLVRADLVAKSYVPPKEIRDVRAILRHRCILINSRTTVKNRIHSILDK